MTDLTGGLCVILTRAGADPEAWTGERDHIDRGRALEACRVCPVRQACLDAAVALEAGNEQYRAGVWGGLTERQRALLAGKRRTDREMVAA